MVAVGKSWRLLRMGEGTKLPIMLPAAAVPREETSTEFRVGWVRGYLAFWYKTATELKAAGNVL